MNIINIPWRWHALQHLHPLSSILSDFSFLEWARWRAFQDEGKPVGVTSAHYSLVKGKRIIRSVQDTWPCAVLRVVQEGTYECEIKFHMTLRTIGYVGPRNSQWWSQLDQTRLVLDVYINSSHADCAMQLINTSWMLEVLITICGQCLHNFLILLPWQI